MQTRPTCQRGTTRLPCLSSCTSRLERRGAGAKADRHRRHASLPRSLPGLGCLCDRGRTTSGAHSLLATRMVWHVRRTRWARCSEASDGRYSVGKEACIISSHGASQARGTDECSSATPSCVTADIVHGGSKQEQCRVAEVWYGLSA